MVADGNCGIRAVVHAIHGQESLWPEDRQHPGRLAEALS